MGTFIWNGVIFDCDDGHHRDDRPYAPPPVPQGQPLTPEEEERWRQEEERRRLENDPDKDRGVTIIPVQPSDDDN